jgi:hypothetical protein
MEAMMMSAEQFEALKNSCKTHLKETQMDDRTKKALLGSIEKWRNIAHDGGEDRGPGNCPLCQDFFFKTQECDGCPVYQKTGKTGCQYTPYTKWTDHQLLVHNAATHPNKVLCKDCLTIATSELEFLESLLPKEEQKMSEDKELKVMESRVKAAMEKCPQGKEILTELFYPKPKEEWEEFRPDIVFEGLPKIKQGPWYLWNCEPNGWRKIASVPFEFKYEDGKFWKMAK